MRLIEEQPTAGDVPVWLHPEWHAEMGWLAQGTTGAGDDGEPFDLGLFGGQPVGAVMARWRRLRTALAMPTAVHARQVHGTDVQVHRGEVAPGLLVLDGLDAHVSATPGLLMTVSVADCVPAFVVDERRRVAGLAHAGWRGAAAGVVERVVDTMIRAFGARPADLRVHFGPAICGDCYEVGPEVHAAVRPHAEPPAAPTPIDLRAALAARVAELGVEPRRTTVSAHCTRCGPPAFFSHRGGSPARQMGLLGVRG